jgi:hypothetical protein
MGKTLTEIAKQLKDANKKVQLIYAFNGSGKTRLSREFKKLIAPKNVDADGEEQTEPTRNKILYYNAFTEDLFYWDNDLKMDAEPKLKIQPNSFTDWLIRILKDLGQDQNIIKNFQRVNSRVTPSFNEEYSEITFSIPNLPPYEVPFIPGDIKIKISKGEESNFIWSIFYTLLDQVITILDEDKIENRETDQFDQLEYVFIDDPVSSLDDNHLIDLAVSLAMLVKSSSYIDGKGVRFVITTHSPLFYNVLWNEFNNDLYKDLPDGSKKCIYKRGQTNKYRLDKKFDGTFELKESNDHPFSYHLFLLSELRNAIKTEQIRKYHFGFLRNILEKTATFLGHKHWENLLEKIDGHPEPFANRILNLSSHSAHAGEEIADINDEDKENLIKLVKFLTKTYGFKEEERQNA